MVEREERMSPFDAFSYFRADVRFSFLFDFMIADWLI